MNSKIVVYLVVGLLLACHRQEEHSTEAAPGSVIRVGDQPSDFMIPSKLWDLLLPSDPKAGPGKQSENDEENMGASVLFAPLTVILEEKNQGVLQSPLLRFEFAKGGGLIDLANYVTGKSGTFYVRFEAEGFSDPATVKVFFLSKAKKRKVGEQIIGSGCKSFMDITSHVLSSAKGKGIAVNTTRNFASSTLGGHFFVSWHRDGIHNVAQARFVDSSQPQLFCNSAETAEDRVEPSAIVAHQ